MSTEERKDCLAILYKNVIGYEREKLKEIQDDKVKNAKSDQELEADYKDTAFYSLINLPEQYLSLSSAELEEVKSCFEDVKGAIELIITHRKYMLS